MLQQLSTSQKQKIVAAIKSAAANFPGGSKKHATSLGINPAIYSRIMNGETEKVIREADWLRLGRLNDVQLGNRIEWLTAKTETYKYITAQLLYCQKNSVARVFCDMTRIGKSYTAKVYARNNANVVYIDCSQCKTKRAFIRALAKGFGVDCNGKLADVLADLIYYVSSIVNPMIILDEAGDLSYEAWLEVKALWNALEYTCGWYMMGADGLKAKINRHIIGKKVGYAEIFGRFGSDFKKIVPENDAERKLFLRAECQLVATLNLPGIALNSILPKGQLNLTSVYENILKYKKANAA